MLPNYMFLAIHLPVAGTTFSLLIHLYRVKFSSSPESNFFGDNTLHSQGQEEPPNKTFGI